MKNTFLAIDLGSVNLKAAIAKVSGNNIQIINIISKPSAGIRKGFIYDLRETESSLNDIISEAEMSTNTDFKGAVVCLGGLNLESRPVHGTVVVSRADSFISEDEMNRVTDTTKNITLPANRTFLHLIPQEYIVDGISVRDPIGMNGLRLELEGLIIDAFTPAIKNIEKCFEDVGVDISGLVAAPLAGSRIVLSSKDKEAGVVAVDLGGETTSIIVFEEGKFIYFKTIPIGSNHITRDLALGLKTDIGLAEEIKLKYLQLNKKRSGSRETIDLSLLSTELGITPLTLLEDIVFPRLDELFTLIDSELKLIGKSAKLPAGAILYGGGSKIKGIDFYAKNKLRLPVKLFKPKIQTNFEELTDPSYVNVIGLLHLFLEEGDGKKFVKGKIGSFWQLVRNFIP